MTCGRHSIVHFDRLKWCHSSFQFSSPLSQSPPSQTHASQEPTQDIYEVKMVGFRLFKPLFGTSRQLHCNISSLHRQVTT